MPRSTIVCVALCICGSFLNAPSLSAAGKKTAARSDPAAGMVESVLRADGSDPVDRRVLLADILRDHPESPAARWQAGFVRVGDSWQPAEEPVQAPSNNAQLREYQDQRARTP